MNQTITLTLTAEQQDRLYALFKETETKAPAYARWQIRPENCVITCYASGKVVFQGKDANVYASAFDDAVLNSRQTPKKTASPASVDLREPMAGSDEVGTGDYFGPVTVCACIVTPQDMPLLEKLGVRDSKALTDTLIRKAAPELMEKLTHSLLIVQPPRYNAVHERMNLNAIKAMLHNQAYLNLAKKRELPKLRVIDQFAPKSTYYRYLEGVQDVVTGITFETKAEDKYPAVGAASVIARYGFLKVMDQYEEHYGMKLQKGSTSAATRCAREFAAKFGKEELGKVAKLHFKVTDKI
ncbi:MAG: ribonuclease HIII [Solobacterium sp.]|nr:ribonuclease HIII [Solobacterium sp.]